MELSFLEGNEIKKVLRALDSLEAVLPSELTPFLDYFRAFKKVRDGSFNSHTYDVNTPVYIEEVVKTAKALKPFGLNFIPKLHMMLHVPAFCERVGAPLGKFGDQGIEQVLYVCLSVWFKVLFLHLSSLFKAQSKPRCIQIIFHKTGGAYNTVSCLQVHQLYEKHWKRWKTKSTDNPNFAARQLKSLLSYNADQRMRLVVQRVKRKSRRGAREE